VFGLDKTAIIALTAAALWGGGDFCGGMSSKAVGGGMRSTMRLVMLAHASSLLVLTGVLLAQHATLPNGAPMAWALLAGTCGGIGSVAFFKSLSRGGMGAPAALCGLLTAAIPAIASSVLEGVPGALKLAGFLVAAVAIWLVAAGESPESPTGLRGTLALAIFSGVAFGIYFIALKLANPLGDLMPVALARAAGLASLAVMLLFMQRSEKSEPPEISWLAGWKWVMGFAVLDTSGNLLFIAATQVGRLDVSSVLAGLYPAGTILLAAWRLHERPTRRQLLGMVTALAAVVMITV
jgi:drug/metabolite transporter (DMT)-like permease